MAGRHTSLSTALLVIIAITAWTALSIQLYILISNTPGNGMTVLQAVGRFFIFFTILTNLLVAIATCLLLQAPASGLANFVSRPSVLAALTLYIAVVGIVYNIVLRSLWAPAGLQKIADELLHVVVPILFIIYWIAFAPKQTLNSLHPLQWLIYPACYLVYALIRGGLEGFYPYPFLDADAHGYATVFKNAAGMLLLFIAGGYALVFAGKKLR